MPAFRKCKHCGERFKPRRSAERYCSIQCSENRKDESDEERDSRLFSPEIIAARVAEIRAGWEPKRGRGHHATDGKAAQPVTVRMGGSKHRYCQSSSA